MKKLYYKLQVAVTALFALSGQLLNAQNVNIPDVNFKTYLLSQSTINSNGDSEIQVSEAEAVLGTLNVSGQNINDLTGIEKFINITALFCFDNNLTNLDISQNFTLTDLNCSSNQLTGIDVSQNTNLGYLNCQNNQITNLDLSQNINLTDLNFSSNQVTNIDLSANTEIIYLNCFENQLDSLVTTHISPLEYLNCHSNNISTLDVSQNTILDYLNCSENLLAEINVDQNSVLTRLNCAQNQLTDLDISPNDSLAYLFCNNNQLASLNVANGNNFNMVNMVANSNQDLECIQHDSDFSPFQNPEWMKDSTASWNPQCIVGLTNLDIDFFIHPNPTDGIIKIVSNLKVNKTEIYSTLGEKVAEFEENEFSINSFNSGVYLALIHNEQSVISKKIIRK